MTLLFTLLIALLFVGVWIGGIVFAYTSCIFLYPSDHIGVHVVIIAWPLIFLLLLPVALYVITGLEDAWEEIVDILRPKHRLQP